MKVAIRVDSSTEIGRGHISRCATLADGLRKQGADVTFLCRVSNGDGFNYLKARKFLVIPLASIAEANKDWKHDDVPEKQWSGSPQAIDFEQSSAALSGVFYDWLIVDNYGIDERWETLMRKHASRIMVIDDLGNRSHDCDLLLDQNYLGYDYLKYDQLVPKSCRMALGPSYALIDDEYKSLRDKVLPRAKTVRKIHAYFGACEVNQKFSKLIVDVVMAIQDKGLELDIVLSEHSCVCEELRKITNAYNNIRVHTQVASLAPLIAESDLAIGAGGMATWERFSLGVPTIVVTCAKNQEILVQPLNRDGLIRWLGDINSVNKVDFYEAIIDLLQNQSLGDMSVRCSELVDGQGVDRIVGALTANSSNRIQIRNAIRTDEVEYLRWANDLSVREHSGGRAIIGRQEHADWFRTSLNNSRVKLFVGENDQGIALGQVRFEEKGGGWRISYSLDPIYRGLGLGRQLLENAICAFHLINDDRNLFGEVHTSNKSSCRIFEALEFDRSNNCRDGYYRYTLCS